MRSTVLLATVVVGFVVSFPSNGQSVADVKRAVQSLKPQFKQLAAAASNLIQMQKAIKSMPELAAVNQFSAAIITSNGAAFGARGVAVIYVNMTCPDDVQFVRGELQDDARYAVEMADIALEEMNEHLTQLTTPAVIAEATKARDAMIEIRGILKPLAGKE
jgi:hypothetical protein